MIVLFLQEMRNKEALFPLIGLKSSCSLDPPHFVERKTPNNGSSLETVSLLGSTVVCCRLRAAADLMQLVAEGC